MFFEILQLLKISQCETISWEYGLQ